MVQDLLVAVALDNFLLTSLHRRLLRWGIGSSGAEGLAPGQLTSSLDNSILIAPMTLSDMSVQPVPKSCLDLIPSGTKTCTDAWTSLRLIGLGILMVDWTWHLDDGLNIAS